MEEKLKMITDHPSVKSVHGESYMGMKTYHIEFKNGSTTSMSEQYVESLTIEKLNTVIHNALNGQTI
jgi:hypothetical protein